MKKKKKFVYKFKEKYLFKQESATRYSTREPTKKNVNFAKAVGGSIALNEVKKERRIWAKPSGSPE